MEIIPTNNPQELQKQLPPLLQDRQLGPFAGLKGFRDANNIDADEKLRVAIIGGPKNGKSWFAATMPKPIAYYDFDNRASSLAGKEGVFIKTLIDTNPDKPTAMQELEADLSMYQMNKAKGLPIPTSYVLDTVTFMKKVMENELFRQDPSLARIIKVNAARGIKIGKSYDVINAVTAYLQYWIAEFSALGNLAVVFHERDEKDTDRSTPTETKYTGRVTADPQYLAKLLTLFNEVFRIEVDGNRKYTVSCRPNNNVVASTTLLIDAVEPPDIMAMLAKHRERKSKQ